MSCLIQQWKVSEFQEEDSNFVTVVQYLHLKKKKKRWDEITQPQQFQHWKFSQLNELGSGSVCLGFASKIWPLRKVESPKCYTTEWTSSETSKSLFFVIAPCNCLCGKCHWIKARWKGASFGIYQKTALLKISLRIHDSKVSSSVSSSISLAYFFCPVPVLCSLSLVCTYLFFGFKLLLRVASQIVFRLCSTCSPLLSACVFAGNKQAEVQIKTWQNSAAHYWRSEVRSGNDASLSVCRLFWSGYSNWSQLPCLGE